MGGCLSKKTSDSSSPSPRKLPPPAQTEPKPKPKPQKSEDLKKLEDQETVKKEIFIIRHRKSHDLDRLSEDDNNGRTEQKPIALLSDNNSTRSDSTGNNSVVSNLPVRTSSCTKEEVDAILIQCGRLSRSSFNGKSAVSGSSESQSAAAGGGHRRKYSGSKRSYDFDQDGGSNSNNENRDDDVADGEEETAAERIHRHRQRQRQSGGSRRRTPSRERSGSRERNTTSAGGSGSRRVSRSPNRRSESPITGNITSNNVVHKPGKMVSVPATISSLVMDKSNNLAGPGSGPEAPSAAASVKRIQVKRNVSVNGSEPITRTAASPRSRSPARTNSKAAAETPNAIATATQPLSLSRSNSRKAEQSPYRRNPLGEIDQNITTINQKQVITKAKDAEQEKTMISNVAVTIVPPNAAGVGRTRSSRLSRDFDLNPETNQSPPPNSYTALLLEDIQNFHQKNSITTPTNAISLPPCLTKACSILEAVADLNSTTGSSSSTLSLKKKTFLSKEPFVESEVVANDDIMEPSIHKYVTVRRGGGGDIEEVESSGSNSVVGGQQQWPSWEPNSADSTDHWSSSYCSSRYNERDGDDQIGIRRKMSEKKSGGGVGKNRVGSGRSLYSSPAMGAATT